MHGLRLFLKGPIEGEVIADDGNGNGIILVIEAFVLASLHDRAFQEKTHAVQRLLNRFFSRTEKAKRVLKKAHPHEDAPSPRRRRKKSPSRKKPKAMAETAPPPIRGAQSVRPSAQLSAGRSVPPVS